MEDGKFELMKLVKEHGQIVVKPNDENVDDTYRQMKILINLTSNPNHEVLVRIDTEAPLVTRLRD